MTHIGIGIIGIVLLFILLFSGMPIGFVMGIVGFLGFGYIVGFSGALNQLGMSIFASFSDYNLSVIPLFVFMGELAFVAGLSSSLYSTAYKWFSRLPGGLAMATVAGCAGFAAICGSSTATAATIGTVALPEMRKYGYDSALATGATAAGGTIGILIPPSIGFVIYGLITQTSISELFLAGILPGLLLVTLFTLTIAIIIKISPQKGPKGESVSLIKKIISLKDVWGMLVLFLGVIGGLYLGVFTPTEAAAIGSFGAIVIALIRRSLSWSGLKSALRSTGQTTVMVFVIMFGAAIFSYFLTVTRIPTTLAETVAGLSISPYVTFAVISIIYLILGCMMDIFSIIILTVPIIFPVIISLGFDPIWFGVIMVIEMEMGLITPPVGVNLFVIKGVAKDIPLFTVARGALPFVAAMIIGIVILVVFPQIATFLPGTMK